MYLSVEREIFLYQHTKLFFIGDIELFLHTFAFCFKQWS